MTRDQKRSQFAYARVKEVSEKGREQQDEYRTLVLGLGPLVLRSGLATALAFLQQKSDDDAVKLLFEHLARADIPGLNAVSDEAATQLCESVRHLDLEMTMLATRELIKVVEWLKRAVEATLPKER